MAANPWGFTSVPLLTLVATVASSMSSMLAASNERSPLACRNSPVAITACEDTARPRTTEYDPALGVLMPCAPRAHTTPPSDPRTYATKAVRKPEDDTTAGASVTESSTKDPPAKLPAMATPVPRGSTATAVTSTVPPSSSVPKARPQPGVPSMTAAVYTVPNVRVPTDPV